jgi:hypothetical protein
MRTLNSQLENLRSKPEHVRKSIAFWSAFGITLVIFAFWVASFTAWGVSTQTSIAQVVQKADTPGQSLVAGVGSFFYDLKDLVFGAKKISYSTVEVSPGN